VLLGILFGAIYKMLPDRSLQWKDVVMGRSVADGRRDGAAVVESRIALHGLSVTCCDEAPSLSAGGPCRWEQNLSDPAAAASWFRSINVDKAVEWTSALGNEWSKKFLFQGSRDKP
jgi:hypothetical protein